MPRYFLHLRYSALEDGFAHDDEGDELRTQMRSRQHVMDTARDLMTGRSPAFHSRLAAMLVRGDG